MTSYPVTTCRACNARIVFRPHHTTGKVNPITDYLVEGGNIEINEDGSYRILGAAALRDDPAPRHISHFSDCPASKSFRRDKTDAR
jgi:hypothetical protein